MWVLSSCAGLYFWTRVESRLPDPLLTDAFYQNGCSSLTTCPIRPPRHTICWSNVYLMLGQRRRRSPNIKSTLDQYIVFTKDLPLRNNLTSVISVSVRSPANMRRWSIVGLRLGRRRRRLANIELTLCQCLVFIGFLREKDMSHSTVTIVSKVQQMRGVDPMLVQCWVNVVEIRQKDMRHLRVCHYSAIAGRWFIVGPVSQTVNQN